MNLDYTLTYHRSAIKFIAKLDKTSQERIVPGLKGLSSIPPQGDIKRLKGHVDLYRLRIGSFRVIFIQAIGNRGDIYKKCVYTTLSDPFRGCFFH